MEATGPTPPSPRKDKLWRSGVTRGGVKYAESTNVSRMDNPAILCPRGSRSVGYYHTHPGSENFSVNDLSSAESRSYAFYLINVEGKMKKAIPRRTHSLDEANKHLSKDDRYPLSAKMPDGFIIPPRVVPFK